MKIIETYLDQTGVDKARKGYLYLVCGIGCYQPGMKLWGQKGVLGAVAKTFGRTEESIYQNMRAALMYALNVEEDERIPSKFIEVAHDVLFGDEEVESARACHKVKSDQVGVTCLLNGYCGHCGGNIHMNDNYCRRCGCKFEEGATMLMPPCKECLSRVIGCHSTCAEYIKYRTQKDEQNQTIRANREREQFAVAEKRCIKYITRK